ncbi:hypothetical protein LEP1GSC047_1161 [Leptospira inadai serovar Lyme str. 10]|uniref:Uncharacterized protein n=2 Tax=Leptospira inadai serovar Lyme TaxID=293084 RepID=V6H8Q9_9LEPT|nr:hypothetical protein LEP1GSC047_1161 [Leptospira inadai serovar Lyme str. 10]PNV75910.1 hypothetical protein BES34_005210 [Leptospira inadai serovar Lyme]
MYSFCIGTSSIFLRRNQFELIFKNIFASFKRRFPDEWKSTKDHLPFFFFPDLSLLRIKQKWEDFSSHFKTKNKNLLSDCYMSFRAVTIS